MYETGTILSLREQRLDTEVPARVDPDDPNRKRPKHKIPFPYNRVRVIGESPVDWGGGRGSTWEGVGARGVLIEPLSGHGGVLDEPYGKLQKLYEVEKLPDNEIVIEPVRVVRANTQAAGPTPEEVFAVTSPGTPPKEGQIRGRSRPNPLGDVPPDDTDASPLGDD